MGNNKPTNATTAAPMIADLRAGFQPTNMLNPAPVSRQDLPKAQLWINLGYDSGVKQEDGTTRFVSLPQGIPLDTQEEVSTKSSNTEYSKFQQARNHLLAQLIEACQDLAPGQSKMVNIQVQVRRVMDEAEEVPEIENEFIQKLSL